MKYYRVLYSSEYAKKNGSFGLISSNMEIDEYAIEDSKPFPKELIDSYDFFWEGNEKKELADIQMSLFSWRFISEKVFNIINKYNTNNDIYFHEVKIQTGNDSMSIYYLMHFDKIYNILIKDQYYKTHGLLRPQIKTKKIKRINVLMYDEYDPSVFLISENVKDEFEQNNIKGASYQLITKRR